jgi:hypothetical protein
MLHMESPVQGSKGGTNPQLGQRRAARARERGFYGAGLRKHSAGSFSSLGDEQVHAPHLPAVGCSGLFARVMEPLDAPRLSAGARGERRKKRRHPWQEELQRLASPWDNAHVVLRRHAHACTNFKLHVVSCSLNQIGGEISGVA